MNFKLLFPSYRNRHRFIEENLSHFPKAHFTKALNLGTGEGDYDPMIAPFCQELLACDINENDIAFARQLNKNLPNVKYQVENALQLSFPNESFDLIISVDVIEHVGQPQKMIEEIGRVLKPNGIALITFPSFDYPFTYDPINKFLGLFSKKKIAQGAYAFGHEYLISGQEFRTWATENVLEVVKIKQLSGYFVALSEMYWTGIIQRIFKANSNNLSNSNQNKWALRPSRKAPFLVNLTDAFIDLDFALFKQSKYSIGKGFFLRKKGFNQKVTTTLNTPTLLGK